MRWVTFDCFGTLVDWNAGFSAVLTPLAGPKTHDLMRAYHQAEPLLEAESPHRSYKDVLASSLVRAAGEVGLVLSGSQADALSQSWATLPVFDDVEPMLEGLRAMGCRLAVLTNCDDDLFEQTHRCFRAPFDLAVTAERVRDYKPSPTHFRFFSRSSGVKNSDWVHVAASWHHDIVPAHDLGIKHVWLDRDGAADRMRAGATVGSIPVHSASEVCDAVAELYDSGGGAR